MSIIGKSIQTESRLVIANESWEHPVNGYGIYLWGNENV